MDPGGKRFLQIRKKTKSQAALLGESGASTQATQILKAEVKITLGDTWKKSWLGPRRESFTKIKKKIIPGSFLGGV